jgi:hypothetical protein
MTASSALARGVYFNNTLVAAANNDVLVGLDINPTFTNGAFTGVSNYALRVTGRYYQNAGSNIGILSKTSNTDVAQFFGTGNYAGIRVIASSTLSAYPFISLNTSSAIGTDGVGTQKSFFQYYGDTLNYTALGYGSNTNVIAYSNSTGNVVIGGGAGFTDAGQKLQVLGNAKFSSAVDTYHYITSTATGAAGTIYTNTYHSFFTGTNYATANSWEVYDLTSSASRIHISGVSGNVAINQTLAVYKLDVAGDIRSTASAYLATTSGSVGIGITIPSAKLHVVGDIKATLSSATTSNVVYYDSSTGLMTYGAAPSGGGGGTLDSVTTSGNTTTNSISVGGLTVSNSAVPIASFDSSNGGGTYLAIKYGGALKAAWGISGNIIGGLSINDVGFWSSNAMAWEAGGAQRMFLTAGGNFLINTISDNGNRLQVNGTIDGQAFAVAGVNGWTGTINIMLNPPGQQNIQVVGGIIVNVF